MKKIILSFLLLVGGTTFAQEEVEVSKKKIYHNIGFNLGSTTGIGPSYRLQYGIFKYQIAFLPVTTIDMWINYGGMFGVDLHKTETTNFFVYSGVNGIHTRSVYYDSYSGERYETEDRLNIGLGAGIEKVYSNNISVNLMFGYGTYMSINRNPILSIAGEIGLFYQFNKN